MPVARRRVLFFGEGVTLAHVTRPLVLARALPSERYDVHFACPPAEARWLRDTSIRHWPLACISSAQFLKALESGEPPHSRETLERYVGQDLELLREVRPDFVVGDYRLSLQVSARKLGVPYAAINSAYWSPACAYRGYPLPELPAIRSVGLGVVSVVYRVLLPFAMRLLMRDLNEFRRAHGLGPLANMREVYAAADRVLLVDVPSFAPLVATPPDHHYVGPVLWSPPVEAPSWWSETADGDCIYLTLGSSGAVELLPTLLPALAELPLRILVATAGRTRLPALPRNVLVADYVDGIEAARRSRLVVCNGGSPTVQQAFSAGVPVLGIPSNTDQFLNMYWVKRAGAGLMLRPHRASAQRVRDAIRQLLEVRAYRDQAQRLAEEFRRYRAGERFTALLDGWLSGEPSRAPASR
jgi:UDP:flavonoid glycosyltransferase YjiC (YdhE family)